VPSYHISKTDKRWQRPKPPIVGRHSDEHGSKFVPIFPTGKPSACLYFLTASCFDSDKRQESKQDKSCISARRPCSQRVVRSDLAKCEPPANDLTRRSRDLAPYLCDRVSPLRARQKCRHCPSGVVTSVPRGGLKSNIDPETGLPSSIHQPQFHRLSSSLTKKVQKRRPNSSTLSSCVSGVSEPDIQKNSILIQKTYENFSLV
jgi:hypothetical protein